MLKVDFENEQTAKLWERELIHRVNVFTDAFVDYEQSRAALAQFACKSTLPGHLCYVNALRDHIHAWVDEKCQMAENLYSGETGFGIVRADLPDNTGSVVFYYGKANPYVMPVETVRRTALRCFNVVLFYKALREHGRDLVDSGYKSCALALGREFGLCSGKDGHPAWRKGVKRVSGQYVIERKNCARYFSGRQVALERMCEFAKVFEAESESKGLVALYMASSKEEGRLVDSPYHSTVPTRTKIVVPGIGHVVFFNQKTAFHVEPGIFESLVSFVSCHLPDTETMDIQIR